jgi:hypothetical protein
MTPKGGTPSMGAAHTPTPKGLVCPDCGSDEISLHSFEECCAILKQQRNAMKAERDAAESLVSAQHDALVAMNAERDWWEHRAEVAERQNGEALAMLAFTGEPSSLWQAAAAARVKMHALTAHMNQVRETLGGSDTVLTLEAAQHVVAKLAEAEKERDDANDALAACQAQAAGTIARLRAKLDECVVALRDIATNYDHEAQTREHTKGYGGCCRVCTAETTLRIVSRTAATEQGDTV